MAKEKSEDDGKKTGGKLKIIVVVVVALLGYKFFLAPKPAAKAANAPKKEGSVVALPELTLNLAGDGNKYLRVGVSLVYWEGKGGVAGEGAKPGADKESQIASDVIVSVLSGKTYADLKSTDGKDEAKKQITEKLNHAFAEESAAGQPASAGDDHVARILFTSFVMQ